MKLWLLAVSKASRDPGKEEGQSLEYGVWGWEVHGEQERTGVKNDRTRTKDIW